MGDKIGLFEWQGLKGTVEICGDVGTVASRGIRNLDLYLMLACGIDFADQTPLRDGGYAIIADGSSMVFRAEKKSINN